MFNPKSNTLFLLVFVVFFQLCLVANQEVDNIQKTGSDDSISQQISLASETLSNNPAKAIEIARDARYAAIESGNVNLIKDSDLLMSRIFLRTSQIDSSIFYLQQVVANTPPSELATDFELHNLFGAAYLELPMVDSALHYNSIALEIAINSNNQRQIAKAQNNMGWFFYNIGELSRAFDSYLIASKYFEETGDQDYMAKSYINLGMVNQAIGNHNLAIEYFELAAGIYEKNGNYIDLLKAFGNIAISSNRLGNYASALAFYGKTAEIANKLNLKVSLVQTKYNMGNTFLMMGDTTAARREFEESLHIAREIDSPLGVYHNNTTLSLIEIEEGNFSEAEKRLNEIAKFISESGMSANYGMYFQRRYHLEERRGAYDSAFYYLKKYSSFADSLKEVARIDEIDKLQLKFEMEKKTLENQKLRGKTIIQQKTIQNQQLVGIFIIIILILIALIALIILRSKRKIAGAYQQLSRLNEELIQQKNALEQSNETKDKMFSVIAHDLRSPFNALLGFLNILVDDFHEVDDEEKLLMLKSLNDQGLVTFNLVENLLEWSMSQRGLFQIQQQISDLHEILHSQLDNLKARANSKNISIEIKIAPKTLAFVDERMMQSVFRNIISNAIKFTPHGGKIIVDAERQTDFTIVKIIDTGIGMSEEVSERLFGNHFPESRIGTAHEKGTGLGLMIVKDFLNKMNATINVSSEPDKGSVFTITLPLSKTSTI